MDNIKTLLPVDDEIKRQVRKLYCKTEEDIKMDVEKLHEWLKEQSHLPCDIDTNRLERFLLRNKFDLDRTKKKIDMYFTYKGLYSQFFVNVDPTCPALLKVRKSVIFAPMPKLLPTMERIIAISFPVKGEKNFNITDVFTNILNTLDILFSYDYASAYIIVEDLSGFEMNHFKLMDPDVAYKGMYLHEEAFSGNLSHINHVNPPFKEHTDFVKHNLPPTVVDKIKTWKDFESLYNEVPKEYLPKEFGGNQESMNDINEKWTELLIAQKEFLKANARKISNENLRIGKPIHEEVVQAEQLIK